MFYICGIVVIFLFTAKTSSENAKKTTRLSKEEIIKQQLIDPIINSDIIETEELNEKVDKADTSDDAAAIIKQYEEIIHTIKKNISIAYHQGKISKR